MVSAVFLRRRLEDINFSKISFLRKITSSILKPFYTISVLFFLVNLVAPKSLGLPNAKEMIIAMLIQQSNGKMMPSGILWFLFVLFAFALMTFVFVKILKTNIYLLFILSVLLHFSNSYFFKQTYYFAINKIALFYVFYVAGYILSEHITKAKNFPKICSLSLS